MSCRVICMPNMLSCHTCCATCKTHKVSQTLEVMSQSVTKRAQSVYTKRVGSNKCTQDVHVTRFTTSQKYTVWKSNGFCTPPMFPGFVSGPTLRVPTRTESMWCGNTLRVVHIGPRTIPTRFALFVVYARCYVMSCRTITRAQSACCTLWHLQCFRVLCTPCFMLHTLYTLDNHPVWPSLSCTQDVHAPT